MLVDDRMSLMLVVVYVIDLSLKSGSASKQRDRKTFRLTVNACCADRT